MENPRIDQSCPGNLDHDTELRSNGTNVEWREPTARDNSGIIDNVTVTYFHLESNDEDLLFVNNSGMLRQRNFFIGSTAVEYIFTDNAGLSTNCTFDVHITGEFPLKCIL